MNYAGIFEVLKQILKPHEKGFVVTSDKPGDYELSTKPTQAKPSEVFAAVTIKKSYVSFHLTPIYSKPELLLEVDERLRKKKQGKFCFNFKVEDQASFASLKDLTDKVIATELGK